MTRKNIFILAIILIIIIILGLVAFNKEEVSNPSEREKADEIQNNEKEVINVKHQYKDGEHVIVGRIETPSPCHSYNAEIIDSESEEGNPEIKITISDPAEDQMCAQVITERDFKVTYRSENSDQEFDATINGQEIELNMFEVSPNEDINTFELFIKG